MRLDLKLFQKDLAKLIGVTTDTVTNWEKNRVEPTLRFIPMIIEFLGYNPLENNATTIGARIKQYRVQNGLSLRKLAKESGIDPGTLARWEKGKIEPTGKLKEHINSLLRAYAG